MAKISFATITVDSVKTKTNTCYNNGMVKIFASGNHAPFFYRLVSGPTTRLLQSNDTFTSLPNGNYIVRIYDSNFDSTQATFSITGNYVAPNFLPTFQSPICQNDSNGLIFGNPIIGTGNTPYTWTLTNQFTGRVITQTNDTFHHISVGNYILKLTDSCANYSTRFLTVNALNKHTIALYYSQQIIACNTFKLGLQITTNNIYPLRIKTKTKNSVRFRTVNMANMFYYSNDTFYNKIYGDTIFTTVYNICNDSFSLITIIESPSTSISSSAYFQSCTYKQDLGFSINNISLLNPPIIRKIQNITSGTTYIDTFSYSNYSSYYLVSPAVNDSFVYSIQDACGKNYIQALKISALQTPQLSHYATVFASDCLDSTANVEIGFSGFWSNTALQILSGPKNIHSSKKRFTYSDTLSYIDTFLIPNINNTFSFGFGLANLGIGKYIYKLYDSCGNQIIDSFIVSANQVSDFIYNSSYAKGCIMQNSIYLSGNYTFSSINKLHSNAPFNSNFLYNLDSGIYVIHAVWFEYAYKICSNKQCTSFFDTITILPYIYPAINHAEAALCNGHLKIELIPDSSTGVAPYQYEIISGPTLFPIQTSSIFQLTKPGIYQARINDTCGNASVYSFTVDTTFKFSIFQKGNLCGNGKVVFKCTSSPYFSYHWKKGNTLVNIGDSIIFNPFTFADTGYYYVTKYVNFHGCIDSTTEFIYLQKYYHQVLSQTICSGNQIIWRNKTLYQTGIYTDTIKSLSACDSLYTMNLNVISTTYSVINKTICQGSNYQMLNGHFISTAGLYYDTTVNYQHCDSIISIFLTVNHPSGSSKTISICENDSYTLPNGNVVNTSGTYTDTLINYLNCDSIIKTYLTVLLVDRNTITATICESDNYILPNGLSTHTAGVYIDTFMNQAGCDSIITTHLSVSQNPNFYFIHDTTLCLGNPIVLNAYFPNATYLWNDSSTQSTKTVSASGFYFVTVTVPPCNTVVKGVVVNYLDCSCRMIFPNGFTPNGDGIDDKFLPISACDLQTNSYQLKVFNRLGQTMFATTEISNGWDGTYKNILQEMGTYIFTIEWLNPATNKKEILKGDINLIR
jgi:gliding motility-associated-like protein